MQRYVLRNKRIRDKARAMVERLPVSEDAPLEVVVQQYKPKRSNAQNERLWAIHAQVSADLSVRTQCKWTPDDVHDVVFKPRFCGVRELTLPGGRVVKRGRSSTELSKQEMAEAQEEYVAWCLQRGIELELLDG